MYIALGVRYGKTTNHIAYVIENMKSGEKTPVAELIPTDTSVNRSLIYGVMRVLILWRFPAEANVVFCFVSDYKAREFLSPVVSALVGSDTPLARSCPEYLDEIHSIVENKHLSLWYRDLCKGDDAEVLKAMEDCSALASSEAEILLGCDAVEENVLEFIRAYTMIIDVPDVFKRIIPVENVGAFARDHGVKPETAIALLFFQKKERPAAESYLDLKPNGQDRYSRLKKDVLFALLTEEEEADFDETIGDYISDPTEALTCLRWYLRGLSLDDAIRKVLLDRANKQCGMFGCISYIRDLGERGKKYHWLFPSVWPDAKAPASFRFRDPKNNKEEKPMRNTIPAKYRTHRGIRCVSPVGARIADIPLGDLVCPCCCNQDLRFARISNGRHDAGWQISCDTCGWTLPAPLMQDSDALLKRLKRWYEAFALLGAPSDRLEEDLALLFDEKCSPPVSTCNHCCAPAAVPLPRSMAVFPCRLHDRVFIPRQTDDVTSLTCNVIELGVDDNGCYFRVDNKTGEKIRVDEIGKTVFLSEECALGSVPEKIGSPAWIHVRENSSAPGTPVVGREPAFPSHLQDSGPEEK